MTEIGTVVAVNIGEIYSGYVISTTSGFKNDPMNIMCYGHWKSQNLRGLNEQIPTSILLNSEKEFMGFGFEAEDQYLSSCENKEDSDLYFFQHFFCQSKWNKDTNGEIFVKSSNRVDAVPLTLILSHSVPYLKSHFLNLFEKLCSGIFRDDEILWVVLQPDKTEFDVRFVLLDAFLNTGISKEMLVFVRQSHAIQTYARHIEEIKGVSKEGIIILNCDSTQLCPHFVFQKYPKVPTNIIGLSSVVNDVDSILTSRLGCSLFSDMTDNNSICDLYDNFDFSLREYSLKQFCSIKISSSCIYNIKNHITPSWNKGFKLNQDKLKIDKTIIHEVFQNALKPLVEYLRREINILNQVTIQKVILVGDFSRYIMTKVVLQESFPQYELIVPSNSYMAATIGATIAGQEIRSRKYESRFLYVPKMSIVGTSRIEHELSGLEKSISENPVKPNIDIANVKENISNLSCLPDQIRPAKIATKLSKLHEIEYAESLAIFVKKDVMKLHPQDFCYRSFMGFMMNAERKPMLKLTQSHRHFIPLL
ncbi:uncharacterized protein LOC127721689 [Mytilus californianus]|uniref:uncharacterized protein LOC127721689 n=1 Tax=Mytilus californianus TaxID=6549 RepID=UPI002245256D|nr:uncharacterized protein LOC127721689 [Mytilus californianus]